MKNQTILILLCLTIISSCTFTTKNTNSEQDKQAAEAVTTKFFQLLKEKKFNKTYTLFSTKFLKVTPHEDLDKIYQACEEKLGSITDKSLVSWKTTVVEGTTSKSEYLLVYQVKRSKFDSKETIRMEKENNQIKIVYYYVNSDGFLEKDSTKNDQE